MPHTSIVELSLLGGFSLRQVGHAVHLATNSARLITLLALYGRPASRKTVAKMLWPDKPYERAAGNLRTAIWRLPPGLVWTTGTHVALAECVRCDVADFMECAHRRIEGVPQPVPADLDHAHYEADLLPGWCDD